MTFHITLQSLKTLSGQRLFLATESSLAMMKNVFYFTLKLFCSQDAYIFVLTFWSCRKTA